MSDEPEDLALDWSNTFFVVGVSLAVVVAVLVILPYLRARFSPPPPTTET